MFDESRYKEIWWVHLKNNKEKPWWLDMSFDTKEECDSFINCVNNDFEKLYNDYFYYVPKDIFIKIYDILYTDDIRYNLVPVEVLLLK